MAATALIVYDQGGPGPAGEAFEGTLAGGAVTVTNDDNTDVASWAITLLDVPPGSALVPGVLGTADSGTPSANFTPDVAGTYRVLLDVYASAGLTGQTSQDIRDFGVRNARGIIIPAYQKNPDPLPLPSSGASNAKPDEQNYGGQGRGWTGDGSDGLMHQFMTTYDDLPFQTVTSTPVNLTATGAPLVYVDHVTVGADTTVNLPDGSTMRVGQRIRVIARTGTFNTIVGLPGAHTINGSLTSWTLLPGMGATFVYMGSSNYVVVDASLDRYERSVVASTEDTDQTGFVTIGATYVDLGDFPNLNGVTWRAIIETTNASDAAEIRLFNVTTASVVASSTLSTTSITPVLVSSAVTLAAGANLYEAQLRLQTTGAPNRAACKQAQLILEWFQ